MNLEQAIPVVVPKEPEKPKVEGNVISVDFNKRSVPKTDCQDEQGEPS